MCGYSNCNDLLLKHSGKVQLEDSPTGNAGNTWKADWLKLRFFNQGYVKLLKNPTMNDALEDDNTLTFTSSIGNYCTIFCKKNPDWFSNTTSFISINTIDI